jgi:hypothetical protein
MADISALETALIKADSAGDTDGARVLAGEIRRLRSAAPVMQNLPTMQDSLKQAIAADVSPAGAKIVGGIGTVFNDAAMRLKQLTGNRLSLSDIADVQADRDLSAVSGAPGVAGRVAGGMLMTGAPAAALYRGAAAAGGAALPAAIAPTVAGAVTGGTVAGLTNPVLPGESEAKNIGLGAAFGVAGDTLARGLARVAQPIMQSPAVQALLAKRIIPTPGQAIGGAANTNESKLTSIPLTGEIINAGRARARTDFNRAELDMATPEGKVSQAGNAGFEEAKQALGRAYDRIFSGKVVQPNEELAQEIVKARNSTMLPLNEARQKQFDEIINRVLWGRIPYKNVATGESSTLPLPSGVVSQQTGQMGGSVAELSADKMKAEIIGDLGKLAARFQKSPIVEESSLGDALMAARNSAQEWLKKSIATADPLAASQLASVDKAFANRVMIGKAVDKAAAQGGVFTPYQAIRSTRPGTEARSLAETAQSVIGNNVPNSGTTDRGLLAYMLSHPSSLINPAEYLGIPLASLAYSRPGSRYLLGDFPGQKAAADAIRSTAPYAANAVSSLSDLQKRKRE